MRDIKYFVPTIFLIFLILFLIYNYGLHYTQYYDANHYIRYANSFGTGTNFNLSFPNVTRGYFWPLIINIFSRVFVTNLAMIIINSVLATILIFCILPRLIEVLFNQKITVTVKVILGLLIVYFWNGYFIYALTDFPALTSLLLAIVLASRLNSRSFFYSGICLAIAFNIRPIYQINLLAFAIFMVILILRKEVNLKMIISFIVGMFIILTPQISINNYYNKNTYSPFVQTQIIPKMGQSMLYVQQLYWGLQLQKYETYVGDLKVYPSPQAMFVSKRGIKILNDNATLANPLSLENYIKIVVNNKLQSFLIYLKHMFNGLDIKYDNPYVPNLYKTSFIFSLLNYIVILVSSIYFFMTKIHEGYFKIKNNEMNINPQLIKKSFALFNILLPIAMVIPVAIEVRFFLPLYLLLYMYFIVLLSNYKQYMIDKRQLILFLFVVIIGILISFHLSHATYNSLSHIQVLFAVF